MIRQGTYLMHISAVTIFWARGELELSYKFSSGTHFRTFDLKLAHTNKFSYFREPQNKITLKFDGLKTKIIFIRY